MPIIINGNTLTISQFMQVVRYQEEVQLDNEAIIRINQANLYIKNIIASGRTVYGINTGFGKLSDTNIPHDELNKLQENLLKSHACGIGPHLNKEVVRGIMLLRVNALAKGYSGIRFKVINQLIKYLNKDIIPAIPEQGSLGASGDLAPLAHMGLTLVGLGEVYYQDKLMNTSDALKIVNLEPLSKLEAKEGLSLINGTQAMTAIGAITLYDSLQLIKIADVAGSLSLEALHGIRDAFDEKVHQVRGHQGQIISARNIRNLTANSTYLTDQGECRVQDAYSLRCLAQVHGASRDALNYILAKVEIEMNAATDNPLVFSADRIVSGGNFHGQPMALVFDFLKIAISELANISERRLEKLVNPSISHGLPAFLVANPGINSGMMIVQYAAASLVSENKVLAHPASVDSIPSSANQEDHVSMGTIAARGARDILENAKKVLAMELLAATQAIDLRPASQLGLGSQVAYHYFRKTIPFLENDEIMYPYLNKAMMVLEDNQFLEEIEKIIGRLD